MTVASFAHDDGAALARALLTRYVLVVGGRALRIEEAEVYFHAEGWRDPFTHRHPRQGAPGRWYFHRAGASATYRGGSFKGLDLTFGPPGAWGGVLIRTISDAGDLVTGPSLVVDHLLRSAGARSLAALDDGRAALDTSGAVHLRPQGREATVWSTARVGLTLRRDHDDARTRWLLARLRFLTEPRIAKGRVHTVIALYEDGADARAIAAQTGCGRVSEYLRRYQTGLTEPSFARFAGRALGPGDYAELHGIWTARHGAATIGA